jgi:hypothetical protein
MVSLTLCHGINLKNARHDTPITEREIQASLAIHAGTGGEIN